MIMKQILLLTTLMCLALNPLALYAKDDEAPRGIVDDSVRDMSIVFGAGAAGAVLGLSTLSFVDEPSKHLKNIGIGGALGIVVGVVAVVFYQATKTNLADTNKPQTLSSDQFASISKQEFIANPLLKTADNKSDAIRILLPF